jgi:glycosyltransferase involved in cell wall biosynthesis
LKRVLLVIKGLGRGGAEQLLASAAPYLNRSDFHYEVAYLLPHKNALVYDLESNGVRTHCLDGARGVSWLKRLRSLVRRGKFDIVHNHSPVPAIGTRLLFGGTTRKPALVYTEHNLWARYHPVTYWANLFTINRADHVFAVSEHVRTSVAPPRGLRFMRLPDVETLYHGIDPSAVSSWQRTNGLRTEFAIENDAPVVGTVANLKPHKGLQYLLEAAREVRVEFPTVRFLIVGTGPLEGELRNRAAKMGLDETVRFTGFRDDAPRVASMFDVFALSSLHEGLSIALIEAMALGKASIVTKVGGMPEVIRDGVNGLVIPPRDPKALAQTISALLRDESLRRKLGDAARIRAQDFDIRTAVNRMEKVYEELGA